MALYNTGFPYGQQNFYNPQNSYTIPQPAIQQPQQNQNGILWVQGEAGAKSYLLAPNTTIPLWDSESQTIFLKSTDASGMPSIKKLKYVIEENQNNQNQINQQPQVDMSKYVTRDELKEYLTQILNQKEESDHGKSIIPATTEPTAKSDDAAV